MVNPTYKHLSELIFSFAASAPYLGSDKNCDCKEQKVYRAKFHKSNKFGLETSRFVDLKGNLLAAKAPKDGVILSQDEAVLELAKSIESLLGFSPQDGSTAYEWGAIVTLNEGPRAQAPLYVNVKGTLEVMTAH